VLFHQLPDPTFQVAHDRLANELGLLRRTPLGRRGEAGQVGLLSVEQLLELLLELLLIGSI
jgi:hypothetical protein